MIDYISLDITYLGRDYLENHELLNFGTPGIFDGETAEFRRQKGFKPEREANYKNLVFEIYRNNKIFLKGSLHKYWNGGKHNYNNFDITALKDVIDDLHRKFMINSLQTSIHHLEFGLNLYNLPYYTGSVIKNVLVNFGMGKSPKEFKNIHHKSPSEFKCVKRDWYILKIYDKAKKYGRSENILRFEAKILKMRGIKNIGIVNLGDLLQEESLKNLGKLLLSFWDDVLINDWTIEEHGLIREDQIKLKDWRNPIFWTILYQETRGKNRNRFSLELKSYQKVVKKHSGNIHSVISQSLERSWIINSIKRI